MKRIFYVYLHKYASGPKVDQVFYVGKGKNGRADSLTVRNPHWANIVAKYGRNVDIAQSNMTEGEAFLLEMWLIAKYRHLGYKLANMTDGGEGPTGYRHTAKTKLSLSKSVYCSNGDMFQSCKSAADWCRLQGYPDAKGSQISSCALERKKTAYGHRWCHNEVPPTPEHHGRAAMAQSAKSLMRPVVCSNGMRFSGITDAEKWLKGNGYENASNSAITMCCKGKYNTAYGFTWWYDGDDRKEYVSREDRIGKSQGFPVKCSNGIIFDGMAQAARWLRCNGKPKADMTNIKKAVDGKIKSAYGFTWELVDGRAVGFEPTT